MLVLAPGASLGGGREPAPVATTVHFAFHSDLAINLNDALLAAGAARNDGEPGLFQSGAEETCFAELAPSARLGWSLAAEYYAEIVSPVQWSDRQQLALRLDLAGVGDEPDARARSFTGIARGMLAAAMPAYEACRWPAQDAENRRWIDSLTPRLAAHGPGIARWLETLYGTPLHGLPIRVDVVPTAPPTGANSIFLSPAGGHILASSSIAEGEALEIVFHEASHTLMRRGDPVPQALAEAASELGVPLPRDVWHVVLFYTTGEAVRRTLAEAGEPSYTPYLYAYERFGKGPWGRLREAVETTWPTYLDGERTLDEAASDLLRALGEPAGPSEELERAEPPVPRQGRGWRRSCPR
jgi:hypothetical protein